MDVKKPVEILRCESEPKVPGQALANRGIVAVRWQVTLGVAGNIFLNHHRLQIQTENLSCLFNVSYISLHILILSDFLNEIYMNESSIAT